MKYVVNIDKPAQQLTSISNVPVLYFAAPHMHAWLLYSDSGSYQEACLVCSVLCTCVQVLLP